MAIPFFDTHLPRKLVELENAEIVNQLFPVTQANQQLTPDALFNAQVSTVTYPDALVKQLIDNAAAGRGPAEKLKILFQEFESRQQADAAD